MTSHSEIVKRFLDIASVPENQGFLVQEQSCLIGLMGYLKSPDQEVALMACEAMMLLASNSDNCEALHAQPGLMKVLGKLSKSDDEKIQKFSKKAYKSLKRYDRSLQDSENNACTQNTPASEASEYSQKKKKRHKSHKRKTHTYKFKVKDLDDEAICSELEQGLIRLRGVISLTLDQKRKRIVICSKLSKEEILPAVTKVVERAGSEIVEKRKKPTGYMDDEEENPFGDEEGVLSRFGNQTLKSRLAAQRKLEEEKERESSKIASVASSVGSAARWGLSFMGY